MDTKTPPGPRPPQRPEPPTTEKPWISPRLREKLDDADPGAPREGPSPILGVLLAVLVIGGGAGLFFAMRSSAARDKVEAERAASAAAVAAAAESTANAARIDSMRTVTAARAESTLAAGGTPAPKPTAAAAKPAATTPRPATPAASPRASATPPSGGAAAAPAPAKPAEKGPFGLDVGTFLAEDRASSELQRLAAGTGLQGKVVTRTEDGGEVYHVVLGSFSTRAAADKRAESLVSKALVNQARTVPLSP